MAINAKEIIYYSDIIKILKDIDNVGKNLMPLSWKSIQSFTTYYIGSICYGNGKFVAVGNGGKMGYSTDGITWTAISQDFTTKGSIYSICYGNGKFVAGDSYGKMGYSTDGITWTAISQDFTTNSIQSIYYGNGKFIASGYESKMAYSQTGIAW